jgi:hypothetical protein
MSRARQKTAQQKRKRIAGVIARLMRLRRAETRNKRRKIK